MPDSAQAETVPQTPDAVVVPGLSTPSSVTAVRSLGRCGARPIVLAESPTCPAARSRYCAETVSCPVPATDVTGYRDALLRVAARPDVATVLPLREADVYVLAKYRDRFADHVHTPWPDFETVRAAQDRLRLLEAAADADVAAPETTRLDEWTPTDRRTVIKPRYSILERDGELIEGGVTFVGPGEEPDRERLVADLGHVPIAQEFVPGSEHGFYALCAGGEPLATFQHERVRSYHYAGGASVYRRSVRFPDLARAGTALLDRLEWHGPAMVECKRDARDGRFRLMEVNPRFWGSLALSVHAGVDFPALYYRLATGDLDGPVGDYDAGVGSHLLRGEVSYLASLLREDYDHVERPSLPGELWAILASLWRDPHFDYLDLDDPRPFLRDLRDTADLVFGTGG